MKRPRVMVGKSGYAKRNRGSGVLNWTEFAKMFPEYRDHIYRVRKDYEKLVSLRNKLVVKYGKKHENLLLEELFR